MAEKESNTILYVGIAVAVIIIALVGFFMMNKVSPSSTQSASEDLTPKTYEVIITNASFQPQVITLKLGDTIKWTNKEIARHTIEAQDKSFTSDYLRLDSTFSHTFTNNGTYFYICSLHQEEIGKIIVLTR